MKRLTNFPLQLLKNGNANCMFVLGNSYLNGCEEFQQDREQAIRWLRKAANLGNKDAKDKLVEIGEMALTSSE